jgi:membrane-bound lytic murein transglycosylase D
MEWETYWVQHRVGKGETLGRIAGRYHVTISELKRWNKLRNDKIRKGQGLKIEQRRKVAREADKEILAPMESIETPHDTTATRPSELKQDTTVRRTPPVVRRTPAAQYYTVRKGDSLWSIAKKYPGTTEHDLMKWNKCGADIRPGQRLIIKK